MKPIVNISDLPREENLGLEKQAILRKTNNIHVWNGVGVEQGSSYGKVPSFLSPRVFVKEISDGLRKHLGSEAPHQYKDVDEDKNVFYSFFIESDEVILLQDREEDLFEFDSSKEILDFTTMMRKHIFADSPFHKIYDKRSSSWKWYKIELNQDVLEFILVDVNENPEILGYYEDQENDYPRHQEILEDHIRRLDSHKVSGEEDHYRLEIESGELSIVSEDYNGRTI